jgi:cytochrome c
MPRLRSKLRDELRIVLVGVALAAPAAAADRGASAPQAFALCSSCHPVTPGGGNGMGPNLFGVVGRRAGTAPAFPYSRALQKTSLVWTPAELDAFLADPSGKLPGNAMPAGPVASNAEREAIVTYLASLRAPARPVK